MSTDGDIEISVRAEGAEDAAGDLAEQGGGGGGDGGGPGGLAGRAGRSGTLGFVLGALLGPILNILEPILGILQAFLAPVALILLRVFQPVLRLLVRILPIWLSFMSDVYDAIDLIMNIQRRAQELLWEIVSTLAARIWRAISNGASWLADGASNIGTEVWNAIKTKFNDLVRFVKTLPAKLGRKIASVVPGVEFNDDDGGAGSAAAGLATNENVRQGTKVILRGGIESFVEGVERETGVDVLP
jgi:hypothetical protein